MFAWGGRKSIRVMHPKGALAFLYVQAPWCGWRFTAMPLENPATASPLQRGVCAVTFQRYAVRMRIENAEAQTCAMAVQAKDPERIIFACLEEGAHFSIKHLDHHSDHTVRPL